MPERWRIELLNAEECDATDDDSSNAAGNKPKSLNIKQLNKSVNQSSIIKN
jgi:hypothetical protein